MIAADAPEHFRAQMERMNAVIHERDALEEWPDGFVGINTAKLPAEFLDLYSRLTQLGHARGWIEARPHS